MSNSKTRKDTELVFMMIAMGCIIAALLLGISLYVSGNTVSNENSPVNPEQSPPTQLLLNPASDRVRLHDMVDGPGQGPGFKEIIPLKEECFTPS